MTKVGQFFTALAIGGLAGLAFGMLAAPRTGKEVRKKLVVTADNLYRKAAYELEELAAHSEELRARMDEMDLPETARKAITAIDDAIHDFTPNMQETLDLLHDKIADTKQTIQYQFAREKDLIENKISGQNTIHKAQDALVQNDETMAKSQQLLDNKML